MPNRDIVESDLTAAEKQQSISISVLTLVLLISPLIIFLVRNATHTIQVTAPSVGFRLTFTK
jgi:hypothetical protein